MQVAEPGSTHAEGAAAAVVVFADGDAALPADTAGLAAPALVVAADGGAVHALRAGLRPDVVVGDLDSVPAALLEELEAGGTEVHRHPADKDFTDLELALEVAVDRARRLGATVVLLCAHGGRLDHELGNFALLASERWSGATLEARVGASTAHVVHGGCRVVLHGTVGELLSILPWGGAAEDVRTEGLAFPLSGELLAPGVSRGISNTFSAPSATVSVGRGTVLVVRPAAGQPQPSGDADRAPATNHEEPQP